jgi:hypothetical protein
MVRASTRVRGGSEDVVKTPQSDLTCDAIECSPGEIAFVLGVTSLWRVEDTTNPNPSSDINTVLLSFLPDYQQRCLQPLSVQVQLRFNKSSQHRGHM